jgi:hypothetical protein
LLYDFWADGFRHFFIWVRIGVQRGLYASGRELQVLISFLPGYYV